MMDADAFALALRVTPSAAPPPAPPTDPLTALAAARRDGYGDVTTWPTCSRSGSLAALARIIDPIDPLDPADDTPHLVVAARAWRHDASVLALAVTTARLRDS